MLAKRSTCALVKFLRRSTRTRQVTNAVMEIVSEDGTCLVVGLLLPGISFTPTDANSDLTKRYRRQEPNTSLACYWPRRIPYAGQAGFHTICKPATDIEWSKFYVFICVCLNPTSEVCGSDHQSVPISLPAEEHNMQFHNFLDPHGHPRVIDSRQCISI
ncbi:hypothetical protein N7G274_006674 [Stereocaulon virgatum]|uniref:Uncharacterized protein n=1 Tax=Stereocaulon virgatum TaxID=373712 RepID=A0ABR4A6K8_9LECA